MTARTGKPDVSVVIAAWNAADFIDRSVSSALAQTGVELEVIVIDDASSDETAERCQAMAEADPRLRYERLAQNGGPSTARNRGLDMARGTFVAVLDADDQMQPDRLSTLKALIEDTGADLVVDNLMATPPAPAKPYPFLSLEAMDDPFEITLAQYVDPQTARQLGACLGFLKPLFRRSTLEAGSHRYDTRLRNSEDYYLVAHLLAAGARMVGTGSAGYRYTVDREGSLSHRLTPALTDAMLQAELAFQDQHTSSFSDIERAALQRRLRRLKDQDTFERVVAGIKSRSPFKIARSLMAQPASMGHVARRLTEIAAAKASA